MVHDFKCAREAHIDHRPKPWSASRVRGLRYTLSLSQWELAKHLNVSKQALKTWEQGERRPGGSAVRLLDLVEQHPEWFIAPKVTAVTPLSAAPDVRPISVGPSHDRRPVEQALTLRRPKERPYPAWWRERTIIRITELLQHQLTRYGEKYLLLGRPCADAPATLEAAARALGPGPFPDLVVLPPEVAAAGIWLGIKWVRLVVDVLPTTRPAGSKTPNLVRWPDIEIKERWIVDPFAHRFTVCRPDAATRHYTLRLAWSVTRFARPLPITVAPFFLPFVQYPNYRPPDP